MSYLEAELLHLLEHLAEGIVAVVGPHCEVVVHDFGDPEHSATVVVGNITGREPGAPVPDLSFVSGELDKDTADQLNYRIDINGFTLQSSTVWIRDAEGTPIGAVCINVDYSGLLEARALLDQLAASSRNMSELVVSDTFAKDLDDSIALSARDFLRRGNLPGLEALSYEEKLHLVGLFEERGLFNIRGAAQRVADLLGVSRATVYNYRTNLKLEES